MKKYFCLILICLLMFTGCSKNYSTIQKTINDKFGTNLIVTNEYKENSLKYVVAKDANGNYYRINIDGQGNVIYAKNFDKIQEDIALKEKISNYLSDDYVLYVEYNINNKKECHVYLFTDYIADTSTLASHILSLDDFSDDTVITISTASVSNKDDLSEFKGMIEDELNKYGCFTEDIENRLAMHVKDYVINNIIR